MEWRLAEIDLNMHVTAVFDLYEIQLGERIGSTSRWHHQLWYFHFVDESKLNAYSKLGEL